MYVAAPALADLFYWTDDEGVAHYTDDPEAVPEKYRAGADVMETVPAVEEPKASPPKKPVEKPAVKVESYGGQLLSWWKNRFHKTRRDLEEAEKSYETGEQFIRVFQKGRRVGQIYSKVDIETYKRYKETREDKKKAIEDYKAVLEKLKKKARGNGVPRKVWE